MVTHEGFALAASNGEGPAVAVDLLSLKVYEPPAEFDSGRSVNGVDAEIAPNPKLTFVIPTRNEAGAIDRLLQRLADVVNVPSEVLFVDDSDDATAYNVRRIAEKNRRDDFTIRLIHRTFKQREGGLGSAVCEGIRRARGEWLCVLDADLQHPPEMVPEMLATAERDGVDIVIGSRYAEGGKNEGLTKKRKVVSQGCAAAAKGLFPRRLHDVSDPLSGFFLLRREAIDPNALHPEGFKILLEILARNPKLTVGEVGFTFSERYTGVSKASVREGARYFRQLGHLRAGTWKHPKVDRAYLYDIHGILSVKSHVHLPELAKFRVRDLEGKPAIEIELKRFDRRDPGELIDLSLATPLIRFSEAFGSKGFAIEVELGVTTRVWASPLISSSPHVLYTNVIEPILRWRFVESGYALVHAACFTDGDDAHLVTARTDTGKTTTMLKILELGPYGFLSDDLTLINEAGRVLTYPKPLTISNHTVHALQSAELGRLERFTLPVQSRLHSKSGREFALYLAQKNVPVATINTLVQYFVPPPKYHVDRLVPGVSTVESGAVRTLSIIQRGEDQRIDLDPDLAFEILFANCEDAYGFPPYSSLEALLHGCSDIELRFREQEIIKSGLAAVSPVLYGSSSLGWARSIHDDLTAAAQVRSVASNGAHSNGAQTNGAQTNGTHSFAPGS